MEATSTEQVAKKPRTLMDELKQMIWNIPERLADTGLPYSAEVTKYEDKPDGGTFIFKVSFKTFSFKSALSSYQSGEGFRIRLATSHGHQDHPMQVKHFVANQWNMSECVPKLYVDKDGDYMLEGYIFGPLTMDKDSLSKLVDCNLAVYWTGAMKAMLHIVSHEDKHLPFATVDMINSCCISFHASEEDSQEECVICQQPFAIGDDLRRLPCLHVFHRKCVDTSLIVNKSCPGCRTNIDTDIDKHICSVSSTIEHQ